jgi:NDP-sugar pyrophosphorylase family protein
MTEWETRERMPHFQSSGRAKGKIDLEGNDQRAMKLDFASMSGVILAGGLGTRLRSVVADKPKVLAPIHGRPFLAYLMDQLANAGLRRIVLCTGYKSEMVEADIGQRFNGMDVVYSIEQTPLGTGGALRLAVPKFESESVLVMNGDSYVSADFESYLEWFNSVDARAALYLTSVNDTQRYGRVKISRSGCIEIFEEKKNITGAGWINAGIYLLKRDVVETIPRDEPYSLEKDLFPQLIGNGLYGFQEKADFIDIGTPVSYAAAELFFSKIQSHAHEGHQRNGIK